MEIKGVYAVSREWSFEPEKEEEVEVVSKKASCCSALENVARVEAALLERIVVGQWVKAVQYLNSELELELRVE